MLENLKESFLQIRARLLLSLDEQNIARQEIEAASSGGLDYYVFILLSAVVATLGLVTNSAPVIIGAMVLAPLMNPVLGVAMAVVRGDIPLLVRSLRVLAMGILIGFLVALTSAWIIPELQLTEEIKNRIRPTIYDLFIGMAAGAGGAFGQSRRQLLGVLPGVAIAVSLMPPLCVTGIGMALSVAAGLKEYLPIFYGSLLLWLSNLAAINLAAIVVFIILGFGNPHSRDKSQFKRNLTISLGLVIMLTIPLAYFLMDTIEQTHTEKEIRYVLTDFLNELEEEAELVELEWGPHLKEPYWTRIIATIRTPKLPNYEQIFKLRVELQNRLGKAVDLTVKVNPVYEFKDNPHGSQIYERPNLIKRQDLSP